MRLPWVSREAYDHLNKVYEDCIALAEYRFRDLVERNDALLEKYHELRLVGGNPAEPQRTIEPKEPDAVQYAINEKSGNRHALKLHLTGWAAKQRALNVEDEQIISAIQKWSSESDDE